MGGCLGPSRQQMPICIDLVDQIYSEADRLSMEDSISVEMYGIIRDKIGKKSLFRKLIEYLSAHRHSLNDTMQHTFRVMRQNKSFVCRLTSLIIVDQLTQHLEQFTNVQPIQPRPKQTKRSASINQREVSNRDIDVRFETLFLQIILELYDAEPKLRERVLQSLMDFTDRREGKFTCDPLVLELLERLVAQAKASEDLPICTQAFAKIFEKTNEAIEDHQFSQQTLRVFLEIWVKTEEPQLRTSCQQIVRLYIDRCMTSRQYGFIFMVIFQLYDAESFKPDKMCELEDHLVDLLQGSELRDQFLKGMYKHLLTYLCLCDSDEVRRRWELGLFDLPYESVRRAYPNVFSKESKKNGLLALCRWLQKDLINVTDLVSFNRSTLVYCFIFNIGTYIDDRDMLDWIIRTFFEVIRICNERSQACLPMIFEVLIDEVYRSRESTVQQDSLLIKICKKCIEQHQIMQNSTLEQCQNYIRQLDLSLPAKIKNEILHLDCSIVFNSSTPFSTALLDSLCAAFFSIHQCLKQPEPLRQKYFLLCSAITLLRRIANKGEAEFLLAFLERLEEDQKQPVLPGVQRYMHRIFCYELCDMLTQQKNMPEEMDRLNLRIAATQSPQLLQELNDFLLAFPSWPKTPSISNSQPSVRRLQIIRRMFQRYFRQQSKETDIDFRVTEVKRNSVVSDRSSGRGDQSFHNVFGLIHEGRDSANSQQNKKP